MRELIGCVGAKEITLVKQALPFDHAKSACELEGKVLGAITTLEEHQLLVELSEQLNLPNNDIWIGKRSHNT